MPNLPAVSFRDRIRELRRVPASSLRGHPHNWRTHPESQRRALAGVLAEVGYADALLARELPDGSLELIDGHLRAELTPDGQVPVLVLDVDEREAALLLATLDPLAELAEADAAAFARVLQQVCTNHQDVASLLTDLAHEYGVLDASGEIDDAPPAAPPLPELFAVQVDCPSEQAQRRLYERLQAEGHRCRLLVI
jgi:hypothetical protein